MGSMSGMLQRPLFAAAAVTVASISTDLRNKFTHDNPSDESVASETLNSRSSDSVLRLESSWVSHISVSKLSRLSFVPRIRMPMPSLKQHLIPNMNGYSGANSANSLPVLVNLYQSAELSRASMPKAYSYTSKTVPSEVLYRWNLPEPAAVDVAGNNPDCSSVKSRTVVVLLGWLGAKQKHLNRYAEWYTSRGFHAITFTFPMSEVLSYQVGGKAEQDVELLVNHLADWLEEEHGKNLVFHTFSNTGWLTYGVILEKFQKKDPSLSSKIRGCIVDSAPVAAPDPQVWASGFSAAFLKKQSIATKGLATALEPTDAGRTTRTEEDLKPAVTETALLLVLEKFFEVVLNLPSVNRRLSDVIEMLSWRQPGCPQLYIYSSADRVIPARSVESFVEQQQRFGREVRACDFVSTPHVDHFRNEPQLYTSQLTQFFEDCVLKGCQGSV